MGAQRGQPLWAQNVDKDAIVGAQRGQPLWAHNVDKDAIVGAQRGEGCLRCHTLHHINGHMSVVCTHVTG